MGKVTLFTHKNNAQSEVANDPLAQAGVTLNVTTDEGAKFPSTYPFRLTIWDKATYPDPANDTNMEIVECTARTTDALTITRAQETTSDVAHSLGSAVELLLTDGVFGAIENAIPKETIVCLFSKQIWANYTTYGTIDETRINLTAADYADCDVIFEVVMKTDNASYTAYAQLYNISDTVAISGSELTTVATSATILRSSALTLTSGTKQYGVQWKIANATTNINVYAARLILVHKA